VIAIGVQVEKARRRERPADRLERGEIPALADIGNCDEQRMSVHDPEG
jgi:hypothetical protein